MAVIFAGLAYFCCVFAAGFALGVMRTLVLAPRLGETAAVALELPVILLFAWITCRWLVRIFDVPARIGPRALMGLGAFVLLLAAEVMLSRMLAGRTLGAHVQLYRELPHALGLAGQIAFASFPVLQAWGSRPPSSGQTPAGSARA